MTENQTPRAKSVIFSLYIIGSFVFSLLLVFIVLNYATDYRVFETFILSIPIAVVMDGILWPIIACLLLVLRRRRVARGVRQR